ncbi:MAG: DUF115 domain-containing protein [Deltaproteobacteria bacterium]|nr:DUF115 domain-containing protein [Deltaproteobacteria bacterium]
MRAHRRFLLPRRYPESLGHIRRSVTARVRKIRGRIERLIAERGAGGEAPTASESCAQGCRCGSSAVPGGAQSGTAYVPDSELSGRSQPASSRASSPATAVAATPAPALAVPWPAYFKQEEDRSIPIDVASLRGFKDCHRGQRCFIIGNGPSLNKVNLALLENEVTFGVNGIFYKTEEMGFAPTYYMVEDSHVIRDNLERIKTYAKPRHRFFPSEYRAMLPDIAEASFFLMNRGFYEKKSPNFRLPRFSADISDRIYCGQTVTYMNFQLAYYMGFQRVYLIGVDFSYAIPTSAIVEGTNITSTDDDPNHFHPEYFGKGKKWHDPQLDQVKKGYEFADLVFKWDGRQIFNATKGGELEVFERVDFDSLFHAN